MMKHTLLQIKSLLLLLSPLLLLNCRDPEGFFYLSDEARRYMIDSTLSSFRMTDNFGITEEFVLNISHDLDPWGTDGRAYGENFAVSYSSVVNNFRLSYYLRAGVESSSLMMEWNDYDRFTYDFGTREVYSSDTDILYGDSIVTRPAATPEIQFYPSMEVRGISYFNIIEVNYATEQDALMDRTPVISYISGDKGLVRFVLKNGVVYERIE